MRLVDLMPRWIHPNLFVFLCPHCQGILLSCKNAVMKRSEQWDLIDREFGEDAGHLVVLSRPEFAWTMSGTDFRTMTITPSINAEASGHWHGHITLGEIK